MYDNSIIQLPYLDRTDQCFWCDGEVSHGCTTSRNQIVFRMGKKFFWKIYMSQCLVFSKASGLCPTWFQTDNHQLIDQWYSICLLSYRKLFCVERFWIFLFSILSTMVLQFFGYSPIIVVIYLPDQVFRIFLISWLSDSLENQTK